MNPHTGDLASAGFAAALTPEERKALGLRELPAELQGDAQAKLAGREMTRVDLEDGSRLSSWAAFQRERVDSAPARRRRRQMERQAAKEGAHAAD